MDVSVIIVNYNTPALTCQAVHSVLEYTQDVTYEVIIVDNASEDNSVEYISAYIKDEARCTLLPLSFNVGFGKGNNAAIERAQGRNIFLLNSDAVLLNNAVKILSDYMDANEDVGICGGNLYNADYSPQPSFITFYNTISSTVNRFFRYWFGDARRNFNDTSEPCAVAVVFGAAFMLKRSVVNAVGAFDPAFFMYAEEEELCLRVHRAGYRLMNVPQAKVMHLDGKSTAFKEQRELMKRDGLRTYYRLSFSRFYFWVVRILNAVYVFSRWSYAVLRRRKEDVKFYQFHLTHLL